MAVRSSATSIRRAHRLIAQILKEMQRGLHESDYLESPEWERLFGQKQSVVANLQKLVAALADLPELEPPPQKSGKTRGKPEPMASISPQEMALLAAWIAEGKGEEA